MKVPYCVAAAAIGACANTMRGADYGQCRHWHGCHGAAAHPNDPGPRLRCQTGRPAAEADATWRCARSGADARRRRTAMAPLLLVVAGLRGDGSSVGQARATCADGARNAAYCRRSGALRCAAQVLESSSRYLCRRHRVRRSLPNTHVDIATFWNASKVPGGAWANCFLLPYWCCRRCCSGTWRVTSSTERQWLCGPDGTPRNDICIQASFVPARRLPGPPSCHDVVLRRLSRSMRLWLGAQHCIAGWMIGDGAGRLQPRMAGTRVGTVLPGVSDRRIRHRRSLCPSAPARAHASCFDCDCDAAAQCPDAHLLRVRVNTSRVPIGIPAEHTGCWAPHDTVPTHPPLR